MLLEEVRDGGLAEADALGELDASDKRHGEDPLDKPHEASDSQEEHEAGRGEAGGRDLRQGEGIGLRDGHGSYGLHGLHRHGHAEEEPGHDVVCSGEEQSGSQIQPIHEGQGYGDGHESPKIPESTACLRPGILVPHALAKMGGPRPPSATTTTATAAHLEELWGRRGKIRV